jgi:hypothetical protein
MVIGSSERFGECEMLGVRENGTIKERAVGGLLLGPV